MNDHERKLDELAVRYFDDELSEEETVELEQILSESSDSLQRFNDLILQSQTVAESASGNSVVELPAKKQAKMVIFKIMLKMSQKWF